MFPGCIIVETDPDYLDGIPDLIVMWKTYWAALECKATSTSSRTANQVYYINLMSRMSFAAFIYPENMENVLSDLQQTFRTDRTARVSRA